MMSSFGYRPNNALIEEGSGPKMIGNSRIAKPSTLVNQRNGIRSIQTDSGKMRKDNENTRSVNVVGDDISRNNAVKTNNRNMSSTRRGDLNGKEQVENVKTSINNHSQSKAVAKGCLLEKTAGINGEDRVRKQQAGVSKIARMDRLSEVRSSKFSQRKIPTALSSAEVHKGVNSREVLDTGSGRRHEEQSGPSLHFEDSLKPRENALAVIINQAGSQRKLQSFSTANSSSAKEATTSTENSNEATKGSAVTKKATLNNSSSNRIAATLKPQQDSSEAIANSTNLKKPMQSFIPSNGIKGIPVPKKSDHSDSKSTGILLEKPTSKVGSSAPRTSGIAKPKEISVNVKSLPKEKSKTSITGNDGENPASALTKKSGVTVIEHTSNSIPRKTDYSRYKEREEIKPRALANANKGHVIKATAQKPRQKIVKEGVVAKRGGQESRPVDCNLQKKQPRENKIKTKEEITNGESAKEDGAKEQSVKTVPGPRVENERSETQSCPENRDVKTVVIGEQNLNLRNDTLKKDMKKVTFDERVVANCDSDRSHGRKKRGDEIGNDDVSREIGAVNGSLCEKEKIENRRELGIDIVKYSRNKQSTPENLKRKGDSLVSALIGLPKPKTKAELIEDHGNRMKHMEETAAKQQNEDRKDVVKPIRSAHVLIDEIVYKNTASLSPPQSALQTFSDQDLRAAVEESKRVCGFRNDRVYNSGSLDRIELRTRSKMKKRQNEYEEVMTLKSHSDPKLEDGSQVQELSSFIKDGTLKEKHITGNSIHSIPITEPIVREPTRETKMPVQVGRDFTLSESNRSKGEVVQPSHLNSRNTKDGSKDLNSTLILPMSSVEKEREVIGSLSLAAMHQEATSALEIHQTGAKKTCITLETSINDKAAFKCERIVDISTNNSCMRVENEEGRKKFIAHKDNGNYLKKEGQIADIVSGDTSGLISSKNSNATFEGAPKQSVSRAVVPPTPPKRTVTNHQRDPVRNYQDCDSRSNFKNGIFHNNDPSNGLVNVVSGKQFSEQPVSQSSCLSNYPATTTNWPFTNQFAVSTNSVIAGKEQQGHWVEQQSSSKTNKTDVSTGDKKDVSFSGINSVVSSDKGKMGQSNTILARPKMLSRDEKLNGIGAPTERHMSPIFEDARSKKPGIYLLNSSVNEMLLNREFRIDELNNKANIKQSTRDAAQVDNAQSVHIPQFQRSSSVPNASSARVEENICKVTKSRENHSEKPKPSSFIASLVRMLQDGRDENKVTSPESTEPLGYDKTVLVDIQVQQNCDPIGLTDEAYFIDEEDPFYQFSLKQGLCDRQARYRKANATLEGTTQQMKTSHNTDSYYSHDKLKATDSTAGLSTEKHKVSGASFEQRDKCEPAEICLRPTTLSINTSHDFITISGHKDRREDSPQDQPTRLRSFSTTTNIKSSTALDDVKASRAPAIMHGVRDYVKVDRCITSNAEISLQDDRSAEVRDNVRKLAELNLLKNSLKVAHASAKSGKKSSSKRKTKKTNASLWESGKNALFYSDNEDLFLTADLEQNAPTKRPKHAREFCDFPEAEILQSSAVENHFKNNAKRSKMDAKSEAVVATDYYKSVIKDGKNGNAGDQDVQADFIQRKSTVDGFRFTHVAVNDVRGSMSSPKPKPSAKIKPYTVVDLSTMSALTPEEVDSCLKEVSDAENRSLEKADNTFSHSENIEQDEAPHTLVLPPKTSRKRSNTTAGDISSEQRGRNEAVNKDGQDFAPLKIVSTDDYSQPQPTVELSSFRARSKTAPSIKDQLKKTPEGHNLRSFTKQQSCDVDQGNIVCISPINRKEVGSDHCETAVQGSEVVSQTKHSMSQDFPPPPSEVELGGKENERTHTPDWPPVPDSVESVGSQSLKSVFLGTENSNQEADPGETTQNGRAPDSDKQTKICDPHRSLPPIPGNSSHGSTIPDAPLAWVSRATPHGTGPFIPMCQSTEDIDDLIKSHFYDDIDQIRKVAQERAMMIKRLEEEEAKVHCADLDAGKGNVRVSLGDMPDLIPNSDDCKTADGGRHQDGDHVVANIEQARLNDNHQKDPSTHTNEMRNANNAMDAKQSMITTTFEKKSKSKFSRLFRKFSAHKSVDLIECKAVTPQPSRRETYTSKREADRNEIFATPATNRRLFSLSKSRPERHRTFSETGSLKTLSDCQDLDEHKRSKNRTVSFGFGRKKAKRQAKLLYKDGQSLQSLEALKMSSDVSSDSGSSTRLSPMTSPTLLDKDGGLRKYHAPEPPRARHVSEDSNFSLRSDLSGSGKSSDCVSSGDELAKDSQSRHTLAIQRFLKQDDDEVGQRLHNVNTETNQVEKAGILAQRNKLKADSSQLTAIENEKSIGDGGNDVFVLEGDYDNYPPSKIHADKPVKPPRSESEDKEISQSTSKRPPEKPLRRSRELGIPAKPEPYSSQRSFRKITDQHSGIGARLSPSSTSEDEASHTKDYQVPFDYISSELGSKTVKSSASDYCLSGHFRRGNMLYHSDRSMERPSRFGRKGSFSSEVVGDSYYENLQGMSDEREGFMDSYDKLLEIHQDTVRQIAEATVFKCDCRELRATDWNDFEIRGKMLNYGISSYVTVPVAVKKSGKRMDEKYTAWLRQSLGFLQSLGDGDVDFSVRDVTMHENLLHICQDIRCNGNSQEENSDEVPHDIHVKRMLVSKVTPRMGLAKYLSLTMDRHARDPDSYEKEACLIILQILKGLGHLGKHGLMVDSIDSESILLSDVHRGVLSPTFNSKTNNNNDSEVLGCPIAMYLALPGLLKKCQGTKLRDGDENSNVKSTVPTNDSKLESESNQTVVETIEELGTTVKKAVDDMSQSNLSCQAVQTSEEINVQLGKEHSKQLVSLIFDVFHASHLLDDGLEDGEKSIDEALLLPVRSLYSNRIQRVVEKLLSSDSVSVQELVREFQVISFCPLFVENIDREELLIMLNKWRNRRCVDMVTDILKKYSLISLASGLASGGTNSMGLARNCVLECQFLSSVTAQDIATIVSEIGL